MKTARRRPGKLTGIELEASQLLPSRHGYSLGELLIVLAILTALAGLSWPTVRGSLAKSRLQDSARRVRTELAKARLKAIQAGVPHRFRFQLDGSRFEVGSQTHTLRSENVQQSFAGRNRIETDSSDSAITSADPAASVKTHSLPTGVRFAGVVSARSRAAVSSRGTASDRLPDLGRNGDEMVSGLSPLLWSAPIIFYPNGSTRNAKIRLLGERGFHIDVKLRGLTGTATVGERKRTVEVDRTTSLERGKDAL